MGILIVVVVLTIGISFCCSLCEAVLYSARMGALEAARKNNQHRKLATQFIEMKRNISIPIAAILILNTIANTAGATLAGRYASQVLGAAWFPLFSLFLTLGILLFSEIIPKNYGALQWRRLWPAIVWPVTVVQKILYPAVLLADRISRKMNKGRPTATITEDEILALVNLGASEGEISLEEGRMVKNIIDLEKQQARDIMTPRTVIFCINVDLAIDEAWAQVHDRGFSRVPVYEGDKENIIGYVMVSDLISKATKAAGTTLRLIIRPISYLPDSANCLTLLMTLLRQQKHIVMLADEFGGLAGLVTLEDVVETILGTEIVDETDQVVDLQQKARHRKHPANH